MATVTVIVAKMAMVVVATAADMVVDGAAIAWAIASAVVSALSTGVSRSRFPLRKISMSKTSGLVLVLTAK